MQQINLYQAEFQPSTEPLLARQVSLLAVVSLFVFLLMTLLGSRDNNALQAEFEANKAKLSALDNRLHALRAQVPREDKVAMEKRTAELTAQIERRRLLNGLMNEQNLGNALGFSAQFEALARQSLATLALDQFSLEEGGRYAELSGWTRAADQLPLYLQNLREEDSFSETRFGVMVIEREGQRADALRFQLGRPGDGS